MYISYIDLLNAVDREGELNSPSKVSTNRSFETKELNNVLLEICDFQQFLLNDDEVDYYEKELQWYFDSYEKPKHQPIDLTHEKWDKYPEFKQDDFVKNLRMMAELKIGCCNRCGPNSNYGSMMLRLENHIGITQFEWVVEKLKKDSGTRLAIAFYNTPNYLYWSNPDFVCAISLLFYIKNNKLNTVIDSRSNDLINSWRFDIIWFRIFLTLVYNELKKTYLELELGKIIHNIFSAHFYLKDSEKLNLLRNSIKNNTCKSINNNFFNMKLSK